MSLSAKNLFQSKKNIFSKIKFFGSAKTAKNVPFLAVFFFKFLKCSLFFCQILSYLKLVQA